MNHTYLSHFEEKIRDYIIAQDELTFQIQQVLKDKAALTTIETEENKVHSSAENMVAASLDFSAWIEEWMKLYRSAENKEEIMEEFILSVYPIDDLVIETVPTKAIVTTPSKPPQNLTHNPFPFNASDQRWEHIPLPF